MPFRPWPPSVPGVLTGNDGSFEYRRDGRTVLLTTRFIPELGWHVFVRNRTNRGDRRHPASLDRQSADLPDDHRSWSSSRDQLHDPFFQARIEQMAVTDKLTGLLNRHGFEALFNQALKESKRTRDKLSVVLFDIDRFKEINDRFGHLAGDAVLQRVGVRRAQLKCCANRTRSAGGGGDVIPASC